MPFNFVCKDSGETILDEMIILALDKQDERDYVERRNSLLESYGIDFLESGCEKARILISVYCRGTQFAKNYRSDMDCVGMEAILRAARYYVPNPYSSFATYAGSWVFETLRTFLFPYSPSALDSLIAHRDLVPTMRNDFYVLNGRTVGSVTCENDDEFSLVITIRRAILSLSKREAFVIVHLFALYGRKRLSMRELATLLDTTTRQIFNISQRAKKKIRERLTSVTELDLLKI